MRAPSIRLKAREREAEVLLRRLRGEPFIEISRSLGISMRGTMVCYRRALDRVTIPTAEDAKRVLLERLHVLNQQLWADYDAAKGDLDLRQRIAGRILQAMRRESALTGSDVPARLVVAVSDNRQDADAVTVAQLRRNLTSDQLRQWLYLTDLANSNPDPADGASVETTATAIEPDYEKF